MIQIWLEKNIRHIFRTLFNPQLQSAFEVFNRSVQDFFNTTLWQAYFIIDNQILKWQPYLGLCNQILNISAIFELNYRIWCCSVFLCLVSLWVLQNLGRWQLYLTKFYRDKFRTWNYFLINLLNFLFLRYYTAIIKRSSI